MKNPEVIRQNEGVRVVVRKVTELFEEGKDDKGKYVGGKWGGLYLRAPDVYFRILEKAGDELVRLGDVAEVRRGFTTGANEYFYLNPIELAVKDVAELSERDPMSQIQVRNGAGWEGVIEAAWFRPVIKSPTELKAVWVRLEYLGYIVFTPPQDVREAIEKGEPLPLDRYPQAANYIEWGEHAVYVCRKRGCKYRGTKPDCPRHGSGNIERDAIPERPTLKSKPRWWDLGIRYSPNIAWVKSVHDTHFQALVPFDALVDQRLYEISHPEPEVITAILNSTLFFLVKELFSRVNLGQGALDTAVFEANNSLIPSKATQHPSFKSRLIRAIRRIYNVPLRNIFEEMGYYLCNQEDRHPEHPYEYVRPEELTLDQVNEASPKRFELDRVVFDALGLTEEERLEVYQAVVRLVKDRLTKAKSNTN